MTQKIQKNHSLSIQGVVEINDGRITVCVEDCGEFDLAELMKTFNGNECKILVSYDENYGEII